MDKVASEMGLRREDIGRIASLEEVCHHFFVYIYIQMTIYVLFHGHTIQIKT
jgi:hypothetical protein